jgi:hypothetical protein
VAQFCTLARARGGGGGGSLLVYSDVESSVSAARHLVTEHMIE